MRKVILKTVDRQNAYLTDFDLVMFKPSALTKMYVGTPYRLSFATLYKTFKYL